jgi:hypothetical protein
VAQTQWATAAAGVQGGWETGGEDRSWRGRLPFNEGSSARWRSQLLRGGCLVTVRVGFEVRPVPRCLVRHICCELVFWLGAALLTPGGGVIKHGCYIVVLVAVKKSPGGAMFGLLTKSS